MGVILFVICPIVCIDVSLLRSDFLQLIKKSEHNKEQSIYTFGQITIKITPIRLQH
jgi:hypothetical protein